MVKLLKPFQILGFLNGSKAAVSGTVSNAMSACTTRHYWPQLAFTDAVETGLVARLRTADYENEIHPTTGGLDGLPIGAGLAIFNLKSLPPPFLFFRRQIFNMGGYPPDISARVFYPAVTFA